MSYIKEIESSILELMYGLLNMEYVIAIVLTIIGFACIAGMCAIVGLMSINIGMSMSDIKKGDISGKEKENEQEVHQECEILNEKEEER